MQTLHYVIICDNLILGTYLLFLLDDLFCAVARINDYFPFHYLSIDHLIN